MAHPTTRVHPTRDPSRATVRLRVVDRSADRARGGGHASAFFPGRCNLSDRLSAAGIDTIIVTGTVTNVCCEATARDAATLGSRVVLAADANAGVDDPSHNATLRTIYRSFGDVRETADITALL